ncbi:MAG: hypothetical protein EON93_00705 [Burkholderiales bacterium]|nr:MAG: hypothetical protein EON93_00705 [Burkholderiales bacterium]
MNISNDDRSRWQQWGTTQQDASKAGTINGPLSGSPDILKIGFEQQQAQFRRMDEQRAAEAQFFTHGTSTYVPSGPKTRTQKAVSKIAKIAIFTPILAVLLIIATGAATSTATTGVDREAIVLASPDANFYATSDRSVLALSGVSTTKLLSEHFPILSARQWSELNDGQRIAVQAMWLRYLKNPKTFLAMNEHHQNRTLVLFDLYLRSLGEKTSHAQPYIDRGRLYLSGLDPVYVPYTAREGRARSAWFGGALALPNNPQLASLAGDGPWDDMLYQQFIRGWNVWKTMLPANVA